MTKNFLCAIGLHKWIGVHEHQGDYDVASCVEGCVCLRCGGNPIGQEYPILIVKNGKIDNKKV